jgi:hypothetical protein
MGEISQDLPAHERDEQGRFHSPTDERMGKEEMLRAAGISPQTARRYQSLAGDPRAPGGAALRTSPRPTG